MGLFRLSPKLTIGESYDDNIFLAQTNEVSDLITNLTGDLTLQSQGRIRWSVFGGFSSGRYAEYSGEDYNDWRSGIGIGQHFGSRTQASLNASFARNHESRGDLSFPTGATEPLDIFVKRADLEILRELGIGRIRFVADIEASDYVDARLADGSELDQDFRNRTVWNLDLRSDFAVGPNIALFARLLHRQQQYDSIDEAASINRDAATNAIYGGAAIWISNLVRGDIGVGVQKVDNRDPSQDDSQSVAFTGNLEFYLTQLLTATLQARRGSGAADVAGSSSYVSTVMGVKLDYELRRNVILAANYSHSTRDYSGIDVQDTSDVSAITAQWLLNRHMRFNLKFAVENRDYALATTGRSFTQKILSADVVFAW